MRIRIAILVVIYLLFSELICAQSIQLGIYSGISHFNDQSIFYPQTFTNKLTLANNNIYVRWEPKSKFSFEASIGYYKARTTYWSKTGVAEDTNYTLYGYAEAGKDVVADYEFNFLTQYLLYNSRSKRFSCFVGGSLTIISEHVNQVGNVIVNGDSTRPYNFNYTGRAINLNVGVNARAAYSINKHLVLSALIGFKAQENVSPIYSKMNTWTIFYTPVPNTYTYYQLGLGYMFKYR